jgi:FlaG/FlaF family flagellin (archaellin)
MRRFRRAISPIIGVVLMVILTVLIASVLATGIISMGDELDTSSFENATGEQSSSGEDLNPWSGSSGDLVRVSDKSAGATNVSYRINFTIQSGSNTIGNSLNSVELEVTTGTPNMFSGTGEANLKQVIVDQNSDGTIDQQISSDVNGWNVQNGGSKLKITFTGSAYTANADDSVIVIFDGVTNPTSPGVYDLKAQTSGDGNWHPGKVNIIAD